MISFTKQVIQALSTSLLFWFPLKMFEDDFKKYIFLMPKSLLISAYKEKFFKRRLMATL